MENIFFKSFHIAGFAYHQGAWFFGEMKIGSIIELLADEDNKYDSYAVELRFNGKKIGHIPRNANQEISKILRSGYDIFAAVIQQLSPEEHPEQQVRVGVFVVANQ